MSDNAQFIVCCLDAYVNHLVAKEEEKCFALAQPSGGFLRDMPARDDVRTILNDPISHALRLAVWQVGVAVCDNEGQAEFYALREEVADMSKHARLLTAWWGDIDV